VREPDTGNRWERLSRVLNVLDFGRPSISGSIRSIKCIAGLNVQYKKDWCVVEMYPEEQGFGTFT
jgi:hypothetical protein